MTTRLRTTTALLGVLLLVTSCTNTASESSQQGTDPIVATIAGVADLTTLAVAIEAAGLTELLQSDGPFTVFAPSNDAFKKLPDGLLERLLMPQNERLLARILTYHVVADMRATNTIVTGRITTVEGFDLRTHTDEGLTVNGARLLAADIAAPNGLIHVIDTVVFPPDLDVNTL